MYMHIFKTVGYKQKQHKHTKEKRYSVH